MIQSTDWQDPKNKWPYYFQVSPLNETITFFHNTVLTAFGGKVRSDRRCGKEFPLQDGAPSECDPTSENPCCSKWGFCGPDADHCACPECVDYRPQEQKG